MQNSIKQSSQHAASSFKYVRHAQEQRYIRGDSPQLPVVGNSLESRERSSAMNYITVFQKTLLAHTHESDPVATFDMRVRNYRVGQACPIQLQQILSEYSQITALYQIDSTHWKRGCDSDFRFEAQDLLSGSLRNSLHEFQEESLLARACLIIGTNQ